MSYAEPILSMNLPPAEAYGRIHAAMWARHFPKAEPHAETFWKRVSSLSRGERAVIVTDDFRGEVHSNGFDGYFGNTDCQQAHEAAAAFSLFGLHQAAEFLKKALALAQVPEPVPRNYRYYYSEERTAVLRQLDAEYHGSKADWHFEAAAISYIRRHPEEFA